MTQSRFTYDEADTILCGLGRRDHVGINAIDGLIAAVVAGPVMLRPINGCRKSLADERPRTLWDDRASPRETILHRHGEVVETLAQHPGTYAPLLTNAEGRAAIMKWSVGFLLGVSLSVDAWTADDLRLQESDARADFVAQSDGP